MVSRLPVFSGKKWGRRVPREMVLPIFVVVVLFVGLLIGYTWEVLTVGVLVYLGLLPFGWMSYRSHERGAVTAAAEPAAEPAKPLTADSATPPTPQPADERPARLN
jgi:CDP-diacylglycerol--serine O-phosphatidyltransferase